MQRENADKVKEYDRARDQIKAYCPHCNSEIGARTLNRHLQPQKCIVLSGRFEKNIFYIMFVLLGWLNFTLKEWLTISRGAEPHAQNANHENRKNIT